MVNGLGGCNNPGLLPYNATYIYFVFHFCFPFYLLLWSNYDTSVSILDHMTYFLTI